MKMETDHSPGKPDFDFEAVFDVEDYLYFYGDSLTGKGTDQQVETLVSALGLDRPLKILDLACGYGRHANRLAVLGHQVTGVDLTEGFLELARKDALMRDVVLCLFTAFGYFDDEENLGVLQQVVRALKPGGRFVLDIQNRDFFMKIMLPAIVNEKEGNLMVDRTYFDIETGRLYNRRFVIRDGIRRDKPFFVRLYSLTEIRPLLRHAGLIIDRVLGSWDGQPISLDSGRMIIIARKDGEHE
jgi:SAM-dependent methyltransferase